MQHIVIPAAPHPTAIDPDTGAALVIPAHVIHGDYAFWLETVPAGDDSMAFLLARLVDDGGVIDWPDGDASEEVEDGSRCPEYAAIMKALTGASTVVH